MGASRKAPSKTAATSVPTTDPAAPPPRAEAITAAQAQILTSIYDQLRAPFMVYDRASGKIIANPNYNRLLSSEVARVQGGLLAQLRALGAGTDSQTPKELLFGLERAVLFLLAATAVQSDDDALGCPTSEAEVAGLVGRLERSFAEKSASAKAMSTAAYALTSGMAAERLTQYCAELRARVEREQAAPLAQKRNPAEQHALSVTQENLADLTRAVEGLGVTVAALGDAGVRSGRDGGVAGSPALRHHAAELLAQSYYRLLSWVLTVDADRQQLRQRVPPPSSPASPVAVATSAAASAAVVVKEFDPSTGRVVLERPAATTRWGLLINERGMLVGVENQLRHGNASGATLATLLDAAKETPILEVNRRRIRPQHLLDAELAAEQEGIWQRLSAVLTKSDLVLHMRIGKTALQMVRSPQEAHFELSAQGGEAASGQRATLILHRALPSTPWGVQLAPSKDGPATLTDFSRHIQFSGAAKDFLFDHRGRLQVRRINYQDTVDLRSAEALQAALEGSDVLALELQVCASSSPAAATNRKHAEAPKVVPAESAAVEGGNTFKSGGQRLSAAPPRDRYEEVLHEQREQVPQRDMEEEEEPMPTSVEAAEAQETVFSPPPTYSSAMVAADHSMEGEAEENVMEGNDWAQPAVGEGEEAPRAVDAMLTTEEEDPFDDAGADEVEEKGPQTRMEGGVEEVDEVLTIADEVEEAEAEVAPRVVGHGHLDDELIMEVLNDAEEVEHQKAVLEKHDIPADAEETFFETDAAKVTIDGKAKEEKAPTKTAGRKEKKLSKKEQAEAEKKKARAEKAKGKRQSKKEKVTAQDEAVSPETEKKRGRSKKDAVASEDIVGGEGDAGEGAVESAADVKAPVVDVEVARAQGVVDVPTMDLQKNGGVESGGDNNAIAAAPTSVAELVGAPALTFDNAVVAKSFNGRDLELTRADSATPWNLKIGFHGESLLITQLPPYQPSATRHPFLRYLQPNTERQVSWVVERLNGKDMENVSKNHKLKALNDIKSAAKITFSLKKFLRK